MFILYSFGKWLIHSKVEICNGQFSNLSNIISSGKTLVCCETAWNDFEKIVNTLGGPIEIERTKELKQVITVYPDDFGGWYKCVEIIKVYHFFLVN